MNTWDVEYIEESNRSVRALSNEPLVLEYTNTKKRVFLNNCYKNKSFGSIEVSITENKEEHLSENIERFLDEASKLYNKIVLGNTEIKANFIEKKASVDKKGFINDYIIF